MGRGATITELDPRLLPPGVPPSLSITEVSLTFRSIKVSCKHTGAGAGIRSPKGGTGEQEGTCGVPRRARGRGAGRAPASVERVKCGFWKMRESSN